MFENLHADLERARQLNMGKGWRNPKLRVYAQMGTWAVIGYRLSHWLVGVRLPILRWFMAILAWMIGLPIKMLTGVNINPQAEIGPGLVIHTVVGVFVPKMKIGANCVLSTGVLIGAAGPKIGDNVYIGPGAKVLGRTVVGNNVVIMANSVVLTDVPDNTTVIGVPATTRLRGMPGSVLSAPRRLVADPAPEERSLQESSLANR